MVAAAAATAAGVGVGPAPEEGELCWLEGRLRVLSCATCHLTFQVLSSGWLSKYDLQQTIRTVVTDVEPLFMDLQMGRDCCTVTIVYEAQAPVARLVKTLDGREVLISESRVKIQARQTGHEEPSAVLQPIKEHFFGTAEMAAGPTQAVQEELFKRAPAGARPDTLVLANLPVRFFEGVSPYATRAENSSALQPAFEAALGLGAVVALEAVFPEEKGLRMDVYVQCRRLADVEKGVAYFHGKSLQHIASAAGLIVPLQVDVDRAGFFSEPQLQLRHEAEQREMGARLARQAHRERLGVERAQLEAWATKARKELEAADAEAKDSDLYDIILEQLGTLAGLLAEAAEKDGEAKHPGQEGIAALEGLVRLVQAAQEEKGRIRGNQGHLLEEKAEKQRLQEVRTVRVAKAKELKALDERWRSAMDAAAPAVRGASFCAPYMELATRALARARDLVLREAAKIINLEEYSVALQGSLVDADRAVGMGSRALQLQTQANLAQTGLATLQAEMRAMGEDGDGRGSASSSSRDRDKHHRPALPPFMQSPEVGLALRKAHAAVLMVAEMQRALDPHGAGGRAGTDAWEEKLEAFARAVGEADEHYTRNLRPAWDRYTALVPLQGRLSAAAREHKAVIGETAALQELLGAARVALEDAARERTPTTAPTTAEAFKGALSRLEEAIEALDAGVAAEKRRRKEEEEARRQALAEEARRKEEAAAEARARAAKKAKARARLARLERRRAFVKESLRIEKAREALREALREARAAGRWPPLRDDDDDERDGGVLEVSVTSNEGSKVVVPPPSPVQDSERWRTVVGPPLNLVSQCVRNRASGAFWAAQAAAAAASSTPSEISAASLRSEVVDVATASSSSSATAAAAAERRKRARDSDIPLLSPSPTFASREQRQDNGPDTQEWTGEKKKRKKKKGGKKRNKGGKRWGSGWMGM